MNVNNILATFQNAIAGADQRLTLAADNDFAAKLTIGQMLKGKVLRQYDGNRYAVDFNGQEKVVDSTVPLRTGEILYGRVVGLGDKVQLQRVFTGGEGAQTSSGSASAKLNGGPLEQQIISLFSQYQGKLSTNELQSLIKLVRNSVKPDLMAMSGLLLSKIGLRFDADLARALYRALSDTKSGVIQNSKSTIRLQTERNEGVTGISNATVEQLVSAFVSKQSQLRQTDTQDARDDALDDSIGEEHSLESEQYSGLSKENGSLSQHQQEWVLGRYILNAQSDGSVAHRIRSIPMWFGDQLIEVDIALFSQLPQRSPNEGIRYQKLVFSLDTEKLGHIEVSVLVANRNLRIRVLSEKEDITERMSYYLPDLKNVLQEFEWQLDEISYETAHKDAQGNVLGAVVDHYVSQDSLSRLM